MICCKEKLGRSDTGMVCCPCWSSFSFLVSSWWWREFVSPVLGGMFPRDAEKKGHYVVWYFWKWTSLGESVCDFLFADWVFVFGRLSRMQFEHGKSEGVGRRTYTFGLQHPEGVDPSFGPSSSSRWHDADLCEDIDLQDDYFGHGTEWHHSERQGKDSKEKEGINSTGTAAVCILSWPCERYL